MDATHSDDPLERIHPLFHARLAPLREQLRANIAAARQIPDLRNPVGYAVHTTLRGEIGLRCNPSVPVARHGCGNITEERVGTGIDITLVLGVVDS